MDHVHHFDLGSWLVVFAYLTSAVGCTIGLACTPIARRAPTEVGRIGWLGLAALSIGGVGIWLMHFIAMLGFTTPGMPIRYDVGRTAFSALLAVAAVFAGLLVFGARRAYSWWRLVLGGVLTGFAVALMHYSGMWALNIKGSISYDPGLVALSVVIAVVAATAALWFTVATDRWWLRLLAGAVMGMAVTGMHFTGMAAVRVHLDMTAPAPAGAEVFTFLLPVFVVAALALAGPISAVLMANPADDKDPAGPAARPAEPIGAAGRGTT
ncbi:MAG TPA: MHYT domain-containing protein [Actinophytocola sp.]|jgi:NO-binding membrane sensor protein with MHYT domain|nr:MHYT domain-containing protein [Actinophytocola sp.]